MSAERRCVADTTTTFEEGLVQLLSLWLRVQAWPDVATEDLRRYHDTDLREAAADPYSPAMRSEIGLQHLYHREGEEGRNGALVRDRRTRQRHDMVAVVPWPARRVLCRR